MEITLNKKISSEFFGIFFVVFEAQSQNLWVARCTFKIKKTLKIEKIRIFASPRLEWKSEVWQNQELKKKNGRAEEILKLKET